MYILTREVHATGASAWPRPRVTTAAIIHPLTEADLVLRAATILEVARVEAEAAPSGVETEASSMAGAGVGDIRGTGYWEGGKGGGGEGGREGKEEKKEE